MRLCSGHHSVMPPVKMRNMPEERKACQDAMKSIVQAHDLLEQLKSMTPENAAKLDGLLQKYKAGTLRGRECP